MVRERRGKGKEEEEEVRQMAKMQREQEEETEKGVKRPIDGKVDNLREDYVHFNICNSHFVATK